MIKFCKSIKEQLSGEECLKKYKVAFCVIVALSLVLELFVFNFRSIESVFNSEISDVNYTVSGASKNSDGSYKVTNNEVVLNINSVNEKLRNVHLDFERAEDKVYTKVRLWAVDEANALGITAPDREVVPGLKQTEYIRTHFGGEVKKLHITFPDMNKGEKLTINEISLNSKVPVCFSIMRFMFVIGLLMLLFTIRPKSFIYKHIFDLNVKWQKWAVIGLVVVQIVFLWGLCHISPQYLKPNWPYHAQYQQLSDALLSGNTYLDKQPSQELMDMENPYDTHLRVDKGVRYEWDHAYYDGHYYVYFGLVPELVFYLPYKAITGQDFPNYMAVYISCVLMSIAVLYLLSSISKKWFRNISFGLFMLVSIIVCNTCGILYIAKRPDFYSIPIVMAMMFAAAGLAFWINAEQYNEKGEKYLKTSYVALGAVCMSLVAGCRPHVLLTTLFGVILFWKAVFKERTLFSKSSIKNTIAICLPYVIVAAVLMIYNFVRFDSPFDFGANYNLTSNDMTQRGMVLDRSLTGIFYYLLQPLNVNNMFPYIQMINVQSLYQGLTLSEKMSGGLIWMSPIIFLGIRGLWKKKWYENDIRSYIIACSAMAIGTVIAVLDSQVAGILTRYYSDFSWILLVGAGISVFAECNYITDDKEKQMLLKAVLACFIVSGIVFGLHIFNDVDDTVRVYNGEFYYKVKYLMGFLV